MNAILITGDVLEKIKAISDESMQTVVTSPPYYSLRDYGVEGQIGLEETPEQYVERLVKVFREVRRVLRKDGTVWLNLGDCFSKKQLMGMPWKVAFALQSDGWYLRSDTIWHKTNCLPSSVKDRPTTAHEYVFLLTKSQKYFYDHEAIKEPAAWERWGDQTNKKHEGNEQSGANWISSKSKEELTARKTRNARSVWTIPTKPFKGAHFATMPSVLVEKCILAGTSEKGCCPECGAPWKREWSSTCDHSDEPVPCCVFDPFSGAATTGLVALMKGRDFIGIELNPKYNEIARERLEPHGKVEVW